MAPRKATIKGSCLSCGTEMKKSDMSAHLTTCPTRSAAVAASNANSGTSERLFHLHVEALHEPEMWFDIEMRGGASLEDLEMYLLAIWLDCGCYHLSFFSKSQSQSFGPGLNLSGTIESTFQNENSKLCHSYDQQSSQCVITCQGVRNGTPLTENPIVLLARNSPVVIKCFLCESPSTQLCTYCLGAPNEGYYCQQHIQTQNHHCGADYDDVMVLPMTNSPRTGMCGYCGPAEPPY